MRLRIVRGIVPPSTMLGLAAIAASILASVSVAGAACMPGDLDTDGDGICDLAPDNCVDEPNPNQYNTDADLLGNLCDADYSGDGFVSGPDFTIFAANFGPSPANPDVDCCDDTVARPCGEVDMFDFYFCLLDQFGGTPSGGAAGQPQVEIEWSTTGAGPIEDPHLEAQAGDTITATLYLDNVGGNISGYMIALSFDDVELSLKSTTEFLPAGFDTNLNVGTGNFGFACDYLYEAAAVSSPPVSGRVMIGEAVFQVVNVIDDGFNDVVTGPCTASAIIDGTFGDATPAARFEAGQIPVSTNPNLVPNPSFEIFTLCPTAHSQTGLVDEWSEFMGTADYYNACGTGGVGVPANMFGSEAARTGDAYVGGGAFIGPGGNAREGLQVALMDSLVAGQDYKVSFYVSTADGSDWALDRADVHFSAGAASPPPPASLPFVPHVSNPRGNTISTSGWTLVQGIYTASGGEDHLIMTNLHDDTETELVSVSGLGLDFGYQYYDDVSVRASETTTRSFMVTGTSAGLGFSWTLESGGSTVTSAVGVGPIVPDPPTPDSEGFARALVDSIHVNSGTTGCLASVAADESQLRISCPEDFLLIVGDAPGSSASMCTVGASACPLDGGTVSQLPLVVPSISIERRAAVVLLFLVGGALSIARPWSRAVAGRSS